MSLPQALENARAVLAEADAKLEKLRHIEPYLIDLSLRENPVGSNLGQTRQDKLHILPKLREFGFRNISLGSLDYDLPDEPEVDDDFMLELRATGADLTGCFAFTALGTQPKDGAFVPSPSQVKLQRYGVPNTVHEIYLSAEGMSRYGKYSFEQLCERLPASIRWLHDNIRGDHGGAPRIFINIVDGCDAFAGNLENVCKVLALLAGQPIEGVTIEDDRGTFLPFQVGAYVKVIRNFLPLPFKILVHIHGGAGFENASVVEALLNGADGIWGGLPKRAAIVGHASIGELLANLARVGNPYVEQYRMQQLLPLATYLQELDDLAPVPDDLPILGRNAYRLTLSAFEQHVLRFMDLVPEAIGGQYGYRVCAVISDGPVIARRLAEVTGRPHTDFPEAVTTQMIRLMRRDLRAGKRIDYDQAPALLQLYERAKETCPDSIAADADTDPSLERQP